MYRCSSLYLQCFHDLDDVHRDRTLGKTSSAAYAAELAVIVCGEIYQLVHESLTEALKLSKSRVAVSHFREIGIHTRIPAAEALDAVTCIEIADIVALAGRADESAGSAAETSLREVSPLLGIEVFVELVAAEIVSLEVCERELLHNSSCLFLDLAELSRVALFEH